MQERLHRKHAEQIVEHFRSELGDELCRQIGDYHFGTLAVLIESAINTSVMTAVNDTITDIEGLLERTRRHAGH
ncbi:MAG: phosphatase [Pseudomonadota bacterium]|nr:phosphatase [Pseudomonadota bacterium]